jgi:hypothetical protein
MTNTDSPIDFPKEENIKIGADVHAGDGGYSIGTKEKYDEFVKVRNKSSAMKFYIDTEFNGFGGKLMSMAIVPENINVAEFYCEIIMLDQLEPWVKDNVVPHLFQTPVTYSEFQFALSKYLLNIEFDDVVIVADWPDDIRYFCEALITGPGQRIIMPTNIKFELNLNIDYYSEVPHNALWDARAIRDNQKTN